MSTSLRYIIFHKPYGVLSQFTSEPGSRWRTLAEFDLPKEIYAAGRLDADSEGLLLLTNDGPFIQRLLEPRFAHPRTYWAQVEGQPPEGVLEKLRQGVTIQGYRTLPCAVQILDPVPVVVPRVPPIRDRARIPTTWIELTLIEGKNRQVRRMTAAVGFPTLRLIRVAMGPWKLEKLVPGAWRESQVLASEPGSKIDSAAQKN